MGSNKKDFSTILGIILAFALIAAAMGISGSGKSFIDVPSILIVLGGTCAITLASFTFKEFMQTPGVVMRNIFRRNSDPRIVATTMLDLAENARKKGLLAMQEEVAKYKRNRFLSTGLAMIIDGVEPEAVERVMRQEIHSTSERHAHTASVLRKMAEVSPAMGLIGTLIGLVQMLGNLEDPSKIGPAMAVALLTTMYGAVLAYMFFSPLAAKLERNSAEEMLVKTLFLRGVVSIGNKENPRRLEMLLNTILPPANRVQYFD
ncbi:MAG: MotA/TolQ/ExbB proton channel family protein [Alphaproteobacteria bacterium]|nr:MotA/TolQ/ExbB proton channel family protein [Alphaproteobacteria bacterium]